MKKQMAVEVISRKMHGKSFCPFSESIMKIRTDEMSTMGLITAWLTQRHPWIVLSSQER